MLRLTVVTEEGFDDESQRFVPAATFDLELEHSLVSLSKWESRFEKPFLTSKDKSPEELLAYLEMMCLTTEIPPEVFPKFSRDNLDELNKYINSRQTATWFNDKDQRPSRDVITSELIYYWMVAFNIPFECQFWHLNRLLTLIKVCNIKNTPPQKGRRMNRAEAMSRQNSLNAQRRAAAKSRG